MGKIIAVALISSMALCAHAPSAHAIEGPAGKLSRGIITIITAPLEVPVQARAYWKEGAKKTPHILVWIFCGAVKGMVNMVTRVSVGGYDVATFPIPLPKEYRPLIDTSN